MTNTQALTEHDVLMDRAAFVATDLRSLGMRPRQSGTGFMVAGCYLSLNEAEAMVARYRRAAARRAALTASVTR
jgi:hypothetical protein